MQSKKSTVADFEAWMRSVGIKWNPDAITITDASTMLCSGLALGITAARDIKEGDELCSVLPKSACICPLTCSIADILEKEELNSGLGLVIAVMHESSLGNSSKWAGYFAAMPQREYLPVFWNKKQLIELQGTEIENSITEDLANVEDDYNTHFLPLLSTYPDRFTSDKCTLQHFHYAASLVASRMFGVDDVNRDGMVPLADIFNHKASVVELAPEYAVHGDSSSDSSDDDMESEEEQLDEEQGDVSSDEKEDEAFTHHHTHKKNVSSALPTVSSKTETTLHGIKKVNGLHLSLEIAIIDKGDHLQIVAASDISAGNEVHNTYGELGNDVLVKKYGFALRYNPFNAVQLKKDDVVAACKELYIGGDNEESNEPPAAKRIKKDSSNNQGSKKKASKSSGATTSSRSNPPNKTVGEQVFDNVMKILEEETDLLTEEDGEEPFEVLPNGYIGPALFATLRVLCSGAENFQDAAVTMEDAFQVDESGTILDVSELSTVQIFSVADEEGKLLTEEELAAIATKEATVPAPTEKTEKSASTVFEDLFKSTVQTSPMITKSMCTVLLSAVHKRLQNYPTTLEETVAQLENFDQDILLKTNCSSNESNVALSEVALSEGQTARRAALTLRVTEQEILKGIETAAKIKSSFEIN